MNFWENDPIATIDATTGDDWWSDDPVVSGKSEIGGVERSALNALQFGINSSAEALDYKNQYEEESPEWLTGVPKPSRYTKLAELETAFESTPKGYKSKGGIPVWENTGREMAMERTRVKVAEQEAAKAREKFLKSGLSPDEYAQKLENERLLRTQRTAKLPAPARWVANFFLDFGDSLFGMAAQVVNDQDQAKYHFKDIAERHAAARVGLGPVGTLIEDVAGVLADAIVIGGTGGGAGLATYYGGKTSAELYTETGNAAYAATGGLIEGVATMAGFKLGAGSARLAKYVGGAGSGDILSNAAKRALKRVGAPSWMRTAAPLLTGPTGEIVGETATDLGHAFNAYLLNGEGDAFTNWANNAPYTALVAGTAGFAGSSVETSKRSYDINSRKELARNMKRVADEIKQASKGIESAVTVIESQPETAKEPIPVPPTSRNGFEKATGQTRTSEAEREAHKDTIEAYNKARDDFFSAVDTLSAQETAERAKGIQKRAKEWIGRDYTDYVTDKNGKERKRKVADPELVERINGLIESDPEVAEGILDTAESMYRELGEDINAPLKEAIRGYFLDSRGLNRFRSKVKRASDPAGVKDFDGLMDHLRGATTTGDQLNYRGMADAIDESQVFDLLKYGWDRTYTGKARALRKALDYYDDQLTRPGQAEPTSDGGFAADPEQTAPTEQQPTQAPESPPAAPQPEVAPVQAEAAEVRPEAESPLPGADVYPDVIRENRPGSRVVQRGANDWEVYHPDGSFTRHQLVSHIPYRSEKHVRHSLLAHGMKDTPENRKKLREMGAMAQFTLSTPNGVMVDGRGVIKLVATANKARLTIKDRHEVIHDLIAYGQMTDAEFDTLAKEYSDPAKSRKQQEEDIANASKGWKKDGSIRAMIKAIINRIMSALHLTVLKPATARDSYFSGRMARRPRLSHAEATAKMVGETNEMLSQPEAAMQSNDALSMDMISFEEAGKRGWRKVYHGTPNKIEGGKLRVSEGDYIGVYFADEKDAALRWGRTATYPAPENVSVIEAYVDLKNPALFTDVKQTKKEIGSDASPQELTDALIAKGFDGVIDDSYIGNEVVVFDASKVAANLPQQSTRPAENDALSMEQVGEGELFDKGGAENDRFLDRANPIQRQPERHEAYLQAEQHGPPSHKDRATAEQQAQALIMGDYQGQLKKWLEASKRSRDAGGLSIHETMTDAAVVRKLIFSELSKGLRGDKQAYANSQLLNVYGWIDARSEEARIHSMRDPLADTAFGRQEALLAAYAGMTGESPIQKGIIFKPGEAAELGPTNIGTNQTEFIDTEEGKQHAKTEKSLENKKASIDPKKLDKALKYAGIDLSQMTFDEVAADVGLTLRAMNVFHALNANADSKVYEFWRNSILSAAKTMLVNAGGSAYGIYHTVGERLAAGAVNTVLRRKGEATLGEMPHVIAGFIPGFMRGLRNAAISWYHEIPALEIEQGRLTHEQIIGREGMLRGAIAGRKGWWIRTPFRTLSATDQFVKTILYEMEVAGLAYRNGKSQGLKGEALGRYMASETSNPMSDTAIQAYLEAKHGVFQGDPGIVAHGFGGVVSTVRKVKGVGKYAAPFKETPASVFEQISKRTPVIGAIVDYANHRRNQKLNPEMRAEAEQVQLTEAVARQLIALTGLAVVWAMNDPDDPWITGTYSEEQSYKPYPPQSIYIPGYGWASYSRVEPFSGMLASTVDFSNSLRSSKSKATVPIDMLASMGRQFSEKTYVQGIADLAVFGQGLMTFDEKKLREGAKLPANIAVGFLPNVYRDTVKSVRNEVAERRAWGKGGDYWTHYAKRMAQDAQLRFDAQPKVDVWGRDIKPYMDNTNFMFRVLAPTRTMDQSTVLPMDEAVYAWNAQRPAKPAEFVAPQKYWREDGETHHLTDEQFYIRAKVAGLYAKRIADNYLKRGWKLNTKKPTENDIKVILGAVKQGKSTATSLLKPYWKKGQSGEQVLQQLETAAPSTGTPSTP